MRKELDLERFLRGIMDLERRKKFIMMDCENWSVVLFSFGIFL